MMVAEEGHTMRVGHLQPPDAPQRSDQHPSAHSACVASAPGSTDGEAWLAIFSVPIHYLKGCKASP